MSLEEVMGGEDHARCTDAALRATGFEEALLDGSEVGGVAGQPFDGGDARVSGLEHWDEAGVNQDTVEQDRAGAALAFAAAFLGAGEAEGLAKDVEQACHGRDGDGV